MINQEVHWTGPLLLYALHRTVLLHKQAADITQLLSYWLWRVIGYLPLVSRWVAGSSVGSYRRGKKPLSAKRVAIAIQDLEAISRGLDDITYLLLW